MKIKYPILLQYFVLVLASASCALKADTENQDKPKINGLSYAAANVLLDSMDVIEITNIGANWVALTPYGFIRDGENELVFNSDRQWVSETLEGIGNDIMTAKKAGLKIMLKPHVWISHGAYTGDFELKSDEDWLKFEDSYRTYILEFAKIAEAHQVPLYCIGTEWRKFVKERPLFWHRLIGDVRAIYSGKLTYAANWDEYPETHFWSVLDYVGVNGYFPLTNKVNPSIEELALAWQPITDHLKEVSSNYQKPILFTEYGYRSIEGTTIKPWESYTKLEVSMVEQNNALKALYNSTWDKPWFAGGFLWKWFNKHMLRGGEDHTGYTPQNKPAAAVIQKQYTQKLEN